MHQINQLRIVCPNCNALLPAIKTAGLSDLHCLHCKAYYSVKQGFLDLIPEPSSHRNISQVLMEWVPLINIYESRWYRYSPLAAWLFGISFQNESNLISNIAGLKGQEKILDIACGPGTYVRLFAKQVPNGFVAGMDLSVPMLLYASFKAKQQSLRNIFFVHGQAEKLPFPEDEFDHINCCGALHLFTDLPKALAEIQRVLKPGGKFTATAYRNWIPGALVKKLVEWHYRYIGTNYFHSEDLEKMILDSGLNNVICHHDKRYWIILSADKSV